MTIREALQIIGMAVVLTLIVLCALAWLAGL